MFISKDLIDLFLENQNDKRQVILYFIHRSSSESTKNKDTSFNCIPGVKQHTRLH